eukprot:225944_1
MRQQDPPTVSNRNVFSGGVFASLPVETPSPDMSFALLNSKKKKTPTQQELQLVLDHHTIAQTKDVGQILLKHEPHVLHHRDKVYCEAKKNGISSTSSDQTRLGVLMAVIEYVYTHVEPPNEYTKKTDVSHFKEVAVWATKYAKQKGIIAPLTLIYASWTHDLERWIPSIKCQYLPESVDTYRKQIIHGITSAKVATHLLKGAPITNEESNRIYQLILYHHMPYPRMPNVVRSCGSKTRLQYKYNRARYRHFG